MKIENSWIRFEEKGERITGKITAIKTNKNGKLYIELSEVPGENDVLRININSYLETKILNNNMDYVTIRCKDATKNFVDIDAISENSLKTFMISLNDNSTEEDESNDCERVRDAIVLSLGMVISLRRDIPYVDEDVSDLLSALEQYFYMKLWGYYEFD